MLLSKLLITYVVVYFSLMKTYLIVLCLAWATFTMAEEPSRTWTSKQGLTLQGAFAGVEAGVVLIKKPNGEIFRAKLDALSAADVNYVNEVSFGASSSPDETKKEPPPGKPITPANGSEPSIPISTPEKTSGQTNSTSKVATPVAPVGDDLFGESASTGKVIGVTLILDPNPEAPSIKELGASPRPRLNDQVCLKVSIMNRDSKEAIPDSTWTIEALDSISGTLKAKTEDTPLLKTTGMFYFLTYSVENNTHGPLAVPIAIITDSKSRKFYPMSVIGSSAAAYIPEGMLSAEKDLLPPGLKKQFCTIYELPKECTVSSIEIFPVRITRYPNYAAFIKSGQIHGKTIELLPEVASASDASNPNLPKVDSSSEKANVFMACRAKTQKGTSSSSTKTRILAYSVDLRLTKPQQKEMTLKAYFIAGDSEGDAIVDIADQPITLQQGKIFSTTVESKPISEGSFYSFSYGSKLKGVIIQVWADGGIIATWTSMPQWDKFAKMPDIQLKMRNIVPRSTESLLDEASERRRRRNL
jgi:hypothetical protein